MTGPTAETGDNFRPSPLEDGFEPIRLLEDSSRASASQTQLAATSVPLQLMTVSDAGPLMAATSALLLSESMAEPLLAALPAKLENDVVLGRPVRYTGSGRRTART